MGGANMTLTARWWTPEKLATPNTTQGAGHFFIEEGEDKGHFALDRQEGASVFGDAGVGGYAMPGLAAFRIHVYDTNTADAEPITAFDISVTDKTVALSEVDGDKTGGQSTEYMGPKSYWVLKSNVVSFLDRVLPENGGAPLYFRAQFVVIGDHREFDSDLSDFSTAWTMYVFEKLATPTQEMFGFAANGNIRPDGDGQWVERGNFGEIFNWSGDWSAQTPRPGYALAGLKAFRIHVYDSNAAEAKAVAYFDIFTTEDGLVIKSGENQQIEPYEETGEEPMVRRRYHVAKAKVAALLKVLIPDLNTGDTLFFRAQFVSKSAVRAHDSDLGPITAAWTY
jgi:hypothetical protein